MLEYFRKNSIPFDNGGVDIKLKGYVVCWQRAPYGLVNHEDYARYSLYTGSTRDNADAVFCNLLASSYNKHASTNIYTDA